MPILNEVIKKIKYLIQKILPTKKFETTFYDSQKKTILIIDNEIPQHNKSSGARRLFEIIKIFKNLDFNIIFLPSSGRKLDPYYDELLTLGVDVLLKSPNRKGMIRNLIKLLPLVDFAWIARPEINTEFQKIIRANVNIKIIFDTVDLHYIRITRQAETDKNDDLNLQALQIKAVELGLAKGSNYTVTVTDVEKEILENEGIKNVFTIPNIHKSPQSFDNIPFENRKGIVFIGCYLHQPNIDAVFWLVKDIMPQVWKRLGNVPVYLLGSYPTEEVLNLASEKVHIPGFINDVSDYFYNAKLFVAPLRFGAGMKGKIGQSLEFGLPIVSTTIGIEGMPLKDEVNCLVADDSVLFAEQIIKLYSDATLWENIKNNGKKSLMGYSVEIATNQIKAMLSI